MLLFTHFPKAGGNSLLASLQARFGDRMLSDYAEDPADPTSPRNLDPAGYFEREPSIDPHVECVFGHVHPGKYARIANARRVVFLREPVANLISIYFYAMSIDISLGMYVNPVLKYAIDRKLGIEEFARLPLMQKLMTWCYFGGFDMSRFDFIGFHETRHGDIQRLSDLLGFELDSDVHLHKTSDARGDERKEIEADAEFHDRLHHILADDCAFYERMRERHSR
jgi:hypothetical protein